MHTHTLAYTFSCIHTHTYTYNLMHLNHSSLFRKIIGEQDLEKETLDAQKEELERQQRLMELKKQAMSSLAASSKPAMVSSGTGTSTSTGSSGIKEQDSQLKSLLQCKARFTFTLCGCCHMCDGGGNADSLV